MQINDVIDFDCSIPRNLNYSKSEEQLEGSPMLRTLNLLTTLSQSYAKY